MVDSSIIEEWINKADEDFKFAKASLDEGLEFYAPICLHFHQAAEKYLKAYIVAKELPFPKIHDLEKLLQLCTQKDSEFNKLEEFAKILNPFYIGTRYPDIILPVDKNIAEKALQAAEEIASFVKSKLK